MTAASVSKTNTPAVLSTDLDRSSDSRFQLVTEHTGLTADVVTLCLNYFSHGTVFTSLREAMRFLGRAEPWTLPAHQQIYIPGISLITKNQTESPGPVSTPVGDFCRFLSGLTAPIARRVELSTSEPGELTLPNLSSADNCVFCCSTDVVFQTARTPIEFRLNDLFRLMVVSSINQVTYAEDQEVRIWGLSAEEGGDADAALARRCLPGMSFAHSFRYAGGSLRSITGNGRYAGIQSMNRTAPLTLSIKTLHKYQSLGSFLKYLSIFGEISLQSKQPLEVADERIHLFLEEYARCFEAFGYIKEQFVFNQMIIQTGKVFQWVHSSEKGIEIERRYSDESVSMMAVQEPLILRPVHTKQLETTLPLIGEMLMVAGFKFLALAPGQELCLYGMDEAEHAFTIQGNSARNIFPKQNPTGFVWSVGCEIGFSCTSSSIVRNSNGKKAHFLTLTPDAEESEFRLVLERANGEELIGNLLLTMSPKFIEELHEMDADAINFLLLRAITYYCCEDFRFYRSDELPDFFSRNTAEQIAALLRDPVFIEARQQILQSPEQQQILREIFLEGSAEAFNKLDRTKLPKPLQIVLKKTSEISNVGTQRTPLFLSRDLANYLRNNPLPAAKDEKTAAAKPDSKDPK